MNFDTIGSIAAIIIGICALVVSIWQGYETRKNYRLSVTPNISVMGNWIQGSEHIGIDLENKGIGPAIITRIEIKVDGQSINILQNQKEYLSILEKMAVEMDIVGLCQHVMDSGDMIAAGEKRPLIWVYSDYVSNKGEMRKFLDFFSRITITVEYKSIYGQTFFTNYYKTPLEIESKDVA